MKRYAVCVATCLLSLLTGSCVALPFAGLFTATLMKPKELGHWVGSIEGVRTEISFDGRASATVQVSAPMFGLDADEPVTMSYEIDDSASPIYVDFVLPAAGSQPRERRVKGIINYISDGLLTLCVCLDGANRPESLKTVVEKEIYSIVLSRTD